jgi:CRISPR/Cas system endoribonuclease Cas6 (RAMP superfamily)
METKINKEGYFKQHDDRTDPEEFNQRVTNLRSCIYTYVYLNQTPNLIQQDLKKPNINETCIKYLNGLKDFVNKTGASYENVHSPINKI